MKKLLFIPFALLLFSNSICAQVIEGKIIDTAKNPISYAAIQINKSFGVLSNDEGEFSLNIENFKPTDSVSISYLGYKRIHLILENFASKEYILEEDINELSEIIISNKVYTALEIVKKVKENIDSNYVNKPFKKQIFQRTSYETKFKRFEFEFLKATLLSKKAKKEVNRELKELIVNMIDRPSKYFAENLTELFKHSTKRKLKVIKAIKLVNKKNDKSGEKLQKEIMSILAKHLEKDATYKVKSGLFKVEDSLEISTDLSKELYKGMFETKGLKASINRNLSAFSPSNENNFDFIHKTKKYNYTLKGTAIYDDEKVYVISFTPKRRSAKFQGEFYINTYDFALIKAKYGYAKGKGSSVNLKLVVGIKYREIKKDVEVYFQKNKMGYYSVKFIKQENENYSYASRPLKFTKNRKDRSEDKRMIKMKVLVEMNNIYKKELYILDENELSKTTYNSFKEEKKYKIDYIARYNKGIWKGYNVLSPVKEISDYKTEE